MVTGTSLGTAMESMALELKNMVIFEIALYLVFTVELKKSERMSLDRFVFCPNPSTLEPRHDKDIIVNYLGLETKEEQ